MTAPIRREKIVIYDSSGGGGHKAVANAYLKKNCSHLEAYDITRKDVLMNFLGKQLGNKIVAQWDNAQKEGDIKKQERLIKHQLSADITFFLPIFLHSLKTLLETKPPPKKIVTTQAMGTDAILKSIEVYNVFLKLRGKDKVKLHLYMTDLPTDKSVHFFGPIKRLLKLDKRNLILHTPEPLEGGKEYIAKKTGLPLENIHIISPDDLLVKETFHDPELGNFALGTSCNLQVDLGIPVKFQNVSDAVKEKTMEEERSYLSTLKHLDLDSVEGKEDSLTYQVSEKDKVYQLMLGSQPTRESVVNFALSHIFLAQKTESMDETRTVQMLCGKNVLDQPSLFKDVVEFINKIDYPKELKLLPLPFQDPSNIARGGTRSDKLYTRAGGSSAMEHLARHHNLKKQGMSQGKVMIVSEGKVQASKEMDPKQKQKALINKIPVWEGGNAEYLVNAIGAGIVSSHDFLDDLAIDYGVPVTPLLLEEWNQFYQEKMALWNQTEVKVVETVPNDAEVAATRIETFENTIDELKALMKENIDIQSTLKPIEKMVTDLKSASVFQDRTK